MCWFPKKREESLNKRLLAFYALVENQLARVEMIERKSIRFLLREKLNREHHSAKLPAAMASNISRRSISLLSNAGLPAIVEC